MKIAYVIDTFPSISETFILDQIAEMVRRGHDVDIEASRPSRLPAKVHGKVEQFRLLDHTRYREAMPEAWPARLRSAAAIVAGWGGSNPGLILDSLNPFRHGRAAASLRLLHERFPIRRAGRRYDVIHCHYGPNGLNAVARRRNGTLRGSILTTFHGYDANLWPRRYGADMYRDLFRDGDLFTVGSEFLRQRLLALGAPADRIVKLPMGVDLARFPWRDRPSGVVGEIHLLAIARLTEVKGIEFLLRAVALARKGHPGVRCTIAGDGPLRESLEALAADLGLAQAVVWKGAVSQEEAAQLYAKADGFVLASIVTDSGEEENQPVVLAEAQAAGLPVIATSTGGIPESVRGRGESALLVPPRDPAAMAAAIVSLAEHPESWSRMGRAGRAHVEEHFDRDKLQEQLIRLYQGLCGQPAPGDSL